MQAWGFGAVLSSEEMLTGNHDLTRKRGDDVSKAEHNVVWWRSLEMDILVYFGV